MKKCLFLLIGAALLGAGCIPGGPQSQGITSSGSPLDPKTQIGVSPEQKPIKNNPSVQPKPVVTPTSTEEGDTKPVVKISWNLYYNPKTGISFEYPEQEEVKGGAISFNLEEDGPALADILEDYYIGYDVPPGRAEGPAARGVLVWSNPKGLSLREWADEHHSYTGYHLNDAYDQREADMTVNGAKGFIYTNFGMYDSRTILFSHGKSVVQVYNEVTDMDDAGLLHMAQSVRWTK